MNLGAERCSRLRGARCIPTCHFAIAVDLLRVELVVRRSVGQRDGRHPLQGHFGPCV